MLKVIMDIKSITFLRVSDNISYQFNLVEKRNGYTFWKREDLDLWCCYKSKVGWCIEDKYGNEFGWPRSNNNSELPPKGTWFSRKEDKSFEYELSY